MTAAVEVAQAWFHCPDDQINRRQAHKLSRLFISAIVSGCDDERASAFNIIDALLRRGGEDGGALGVAEFLVKEITPLVTAVEIVPATPHVGEKTKIQASVSRKILSNGDMLARLKYDKESHVRIELMAEDMVAPATSSGVLTIGKNDFGSGVCFEVHPRKPGAKSVAVDFFLGREFYARRTLTVEVKPTN